MNTPPRPSWRPTNKWFAARVLALAGILTLFVTTDNWDDEEWVATITLAAEALTSYLVPNEQTTTGTGVRPR